MHLLSAARISRRAIVFLPLVLLFGLSVMHGQAAPGPVSRGAVSQSGMRPVPNRVTEPVDSARVRALPHHVPLWANAANSEGPASGEMMLTMVLARSAEQQAELEQLLQDQKTPSSPAYHRWLTPEQVGERFGLSDADVSAVESWLQSQGLQVRWVSPSRTFVGFSGPAEAVGRAFGTQVRKYRVNGVERLSVASDPLIPAALRPVVRAVRGLYTVEDRPAHFMSHAQMSGPEMTLGGSTHFIVQQDFRTIYDGAVSYSGAGQTIGIVGRSRVDSADIYNFQYLTQTSFGIARELVPTAFGAVDPGPALTTPPTGSSSTGDQAEATLDVTRAGSVAPAAKLLLVVATTASGGIETDAQYLVQTSPVPAQVMSISFGQCEAAAGTAAVDFWNTLFEQAALEGISVFVSSWDSGAAGCEPAFTTPATNPPAVSPNYICSSPYATCVGGTEFNDTANASQYWSASNATNYASALSYIPEGGWNEPLNDKSAPQVAGSGGGVSSVMATPSWQSGPGVPGARAGRYTPDVPFSSSCHDGYLGCLAAAGASCMRDSNGNIYFTAFCGTSAAAPSMAGVAALLDEKMQIPQGNLNPEIYALAQSAPATFHDATPATSGVATCDLATPSLCNNSTPGPTGVTGGQAGYAVTAGYDLVTGVGSTDIAAFLNNFANALPAPTVTVTPSAATTSATVPLSVTVTVDGGSGNPTPSGAVILSGGPYTSAATALSNGSATITIPAGALPANTTSYVLNVRYTPDDASATTYSIGIGSCTVLIQAVAPTLTLDFSPWPVSTAQDLTITAKVDGGNGAPVPTGMVAADAPWLWGGSYRAWGSLSGGSAIMTIPAGLLAAGDVTVKAAYEPDLKAQVYYGAATGVSTVSLTPVTKTTPTVTVALSPTSIASNQQLAFFVTVVPAPGGPTPTGIISIDDGVYNSGGYPSASNKLDKIYSPWTYRPGSYQITAKYLGDSNNSPATGSATLTVTKAVPVVKVTACSAMISPTQPCSVNVGVYGAGGGPIATGTVMLTSGSYSSDPVTLDLGGTGATIVIPAGALPVGTNQLSAVYAGDSTYAGATGSGSVSVGVVPPSFTIAGSGITFIQAGARTGNTSTITVTPVAGFTGSVNLTAAITSSPAGAQYLPTLSFGATNPVSITGAAGGTATLTIATTAAPTAMLHSAMPGERWYSAGETALACLFLIGIPARRRRAWRVMLGTALLLVSFSSGMVACGGGGGKNTVPAAGSAPVAGTTPGTYVVTITGTSGSITATGALNVVVQ